MKSKNQLFICLFISLIIQTTSLFSQVKKDEVIEMKNFPSKYVDYGTETLDVYYEPYQLKVDKFMESKGYKDGNWMSLKFIGENHS